MRPVFSATSSLVILALFLVALRLFVGLTPLEQFMQKLVGPLSSVISGVESSQEDEPQLDTSQQSRIENLEQENSLLREQLELEANQTSAEVIKKDITGFRKSMILNKGSKSGLSEGQAVMAEGFLIGKIERTTSGTSIVQLITDPQFKVTAATRSGDGGVVKSDSGSLVFDLVPSDSAEGRQIFTDGVDAQVSPNIPIGVLGKRITTDDKAFHTYHLILPVPFSRIKVVTVSLDGKQ